MKTDVSNLSETRVKIVVEVPFEELTDELAKAYRKIASQTQVPGFRRGKVPPRVIDQRFGRATVLSEVVNEIIPRTYESVVAEQGFTPLSQPEVEVTRLEDGELIEFTAEVDIRPNFDLPEHAGLRVEVDEAIVTEEDVEEQLLSLRTRFATFNPVDRPAGDGDVLLVDIVATSDGEPVDEYSATALSYELGTEGAVEGFDQAVTGAVAEEVREFVHTPTDGPHEGRDIAVAVTVHAVRERVLPDADDDFATLASEFDTIDELRADLRERLGRVRLVEQGQQARTRAHDAYVDQIDVPLPQSLITGQLEEHFTDGHGDDEHRAEFEAELRKNLKSQLVMDKLAEEQELSVTEQELSAWLVAQAPRYGMGPDEFANALVQAGQVQQAISDVRRGKALELILSAAKIVDTTGSPVDLDALSELLTGAPSINPADIEEIAAPDVEGEQGDEADVEPQAAEPERLAAEAEPQA